MDKQRFDSNLVMINNNLLTSSLLQVGITLLSQFSMRPSVEMERTLLVLINRETQKL